MEWALWRWCARRAVYEPLVDALLTPPASTDPKNWAVLRVYGARSGDRLDKQRFWRRFARAHAGRRNAVVHRWADVPRAGAAASLGVATELTAHLARVLG